MKNKKKILGGLSILTGVVAGIGLILYKKQDSKKINTKETYTSLNAGEFIEATVTNLYHMYEELNFLKDTSIIFAEDVFADLAFTAPDLVENSISKFEYKISTDATFIKNLPLYNCSYDLKALDLIASEINEIIDNISLLEMQILDAYKNQEFEKLKYSYPNEAELVQISILQLIDILKDTAVDLIDITNNKF